MISDFAPGTPHRVAPGIVRVVAPNPGMLTGPGTNTYLVGETELAVVDPGPDDVSHVAAVVAAGQGRIAWILVSHTHRDHSPAARCLREMTGATVVGLGAPGDGRQDRHFRPDARPADGERVLLDGVTLRCIATPGHASNHLCFLLEESAVLFTGDHILGTTSPVILPPDGDMAAYLESLARLRSLPLVALAPGHGPLLDDPAAVIDGLVAHRLEREARTRHALRQLGTATLDELLPNVYEDLDPALFELARHSLLAHLIKLEREGLARRDAGRWSGPG